MPATNERMLEKAAGLDVDEIVIDFEDSVAPELKSNVTRERVAETVAGLAWRTRRLSLRVNACGSPWFEDDLAVLVPGAGNALASVVLPKVEDESALRDARERLAAVSSELSLQAQIESALGVVNVESIARSGGDAGLDTLIFGPGDYAASVGVLEPVLGGIDPRFPGDQWQFARSRIVNAARAFGLDVLDGPYAAFGDEEGLVESATRARLLGFTGKWVIHPRQAPIVTAVFSPSSEEVENARQILRALAASETDGAGATVHAGQMVDAATVRMARRVLELADGHTAGG